MTSAVSVAIEVMAGGAPGLVHWDIVYSSRRARRPDRAWSGTTACGARLAGLVLGVEDPRILTCEACIEAYVRVALTSEPG